MQSAGSMARNNELEMAMVVSSFYNELRPFREGEAQDHVVTKGVQKAMWSAMARTEVGVQQCWKLEDDVTKHGVSNVLSQIQVPTFHAYWHQFLPRNTTSFCVICSLSWWIGLVKANYYKRPVQQVAVCLHEALYSSGQLTGRCRGPWCFHLRYALGSCLYQIAFYECDANPWMNKKLMLNIASWELTSFIIGVAAQWTELAHRYAPWALTALSNVGKLVIKLHDHDQSYSVVLKLYKEVAELARKLGLVELERLLMELCSGLEEFEDHKVAAAFKIFVKVLKFGVDRVIENGSTHDDDDLFRSFDVLSHVCWWINKSWRSLEFKHLTDLPKMRTVEDSVHASVGLCMILLGLALRVLGTEEEALYYLEGACRMCASDPELASSLHYIQHAIARGYGGRVMKDHRKAAEMYEAAAKTAPDLQTQLELDMHAALEWVKVMPPEEIARGMERMQVVVCMAVKSLPREWELQACLSFQAGLAHLQAGDVNGGIEHLEVGRSLCVANDFAFAWRERAAYTRQSIMGLAVLMAEYSDKEDLAAALFLYNSVHPLFENLRSITGGESVWKDTAWRCWKQGKEALARATGVMDDVAKDSHSLRYFSLDRADMMLQEDIGGDTTYLYVIADYFQALAEDRVKADDLAGAVEALDDLEEKLLQRGLLGKTGKVVLHKKRALYWRNAGELPQALDEIQKAVERIPDVDQDQVPDLVSMLYLEQSQILWKLEDAEGARVSLVMAEKSLSGSLNETLRLIKFWESHMLYEERKFEEAAQVLREVALLHVDAQANLGVESAWVSYLDNTTMAAAFVNVESLKRKQKQMIEALIWAERGRARLFMHRVNKTRGPIEFDTSDEYAEDIIFKSIELCGPDTVIIECSLMSITDTETTLILYALFHHVAVGYGCGSHEKDMKEFFKVKENCVAGRSLNALVFKVRRLIRAGKDEEAIPGLRILHSLLVQSIFDIYKDQLRYCTNIIFSPQGILHLVPFTALYDGSAKKFLIEQKGVSVIPSIRSLHHCFARQEKFESKFQSMDCAFVAGNPKPMGQNRTQLPGAAQEAQQVARILGVDPCKGENITKEVVVKALSERSLVLLATHGLPCSKEHPFGAVVLKGIPPNYNNTFVDRDVVGTSSPKQQQLNEVLTFNDIAAMEGVSAGLVVLSACFSGDGEVSREGLLGLGHAILQAGAASAIVALWDVDDDSTRTLIASIFEELKKGTDIQHAVQKALVDMLQSPKPRKLRDWSAFTLLGSPTFQLPGHTPTPKVSSMKDFHHFDMNSELSAEDIGGRAMYLRAVVHYYRDWAERKREGGYIEAAIATVDCLEENLKKNGLLVSPIAKSKFHLWRGKYHNLSTKGTLQALVELQRAMEVLPDLEKSSQSELVAEIFLEQARAHLKLSDQNAAISVLEKAQESVSKSKNSKLLYHSKVYHTFACSNDRDFKAAVALAREAGYLEDVSTMWVPFVENACVTSRFALYELLSFQQQNGNKAVVWAEQSSTISPQDDETDSEAAASLLRTVALCGPDAIIFKYTFHHPKILVVYALHSKATQSLQLNLKLFFSQEANCVMGTSLEELVSRVREHISNGEDEKAIPGLSILYNLLVQELLEDYRNFFGHASMFKLIFAPQGVLCHIPFAALYNASARKFLVEQVPVGVIPSVRLLHRCFFWQHKFERSKFERSCKPAKTLDSSAFVGSNVEPMEQLLGTVQTLQEVANILDVEACLGSNLTKATVLDALCSRNIVMLAVQNRGGSKQEQLYPNGAVVLSHEQMLTCEEIIALGDKITAKLMVITTCHNEIQHDKPFSRSVGLLGLGHAALEAGAVSVIASLWNIDQDALKPLVTALFRELKQGTDVLHSMQRAMQETLKSSELRHWASLTLLGSPTQRINHSTHEAQIVHPESQNYSSPVLEKMRTQCLEEINVVTDRGPLNALPEEICVKVLQWLALQMVAKVTKAKQGGNLKMEITQCRYLGMVYGAMKEWSSAQYWLARCLSVAKENWEPVKDDQNLVSILPSTSVFLEALALENSQCTSSTL